MEKEWIEIGRASVKAKVLNVCGGEYPTLLCLVKEVFYEYRWQKKTGKIVFDDYSYKMSFLVKDVPVWVLDYNDCDAVAKAKKLVNGDIVEFTICRDDYQYFFTSFDIIETEQKALEHLEGLEHLVNEFGKKDK